MLTFQQQFNIIDTQINEYKSQKRVYKHFNTFEEPFHCSSVYNFIKHSISHIKDTNFNTCKTINVYAKQANGVIHKIYYLSTDYSGSIINKEKYREDKEIIPPFDIYIQIETTNLPFLSLLFHPKKY